MYSNDIAIIGMSGIFPGAKNVNEFWDNIKNGVESIEFFSDEELLKAGVSKELLNNKKYVKAGTYIEEAETFDYSFFDITKREAELMDPQHRLFLEHSYNALNDSGYSMVNEEVKVGVFASEFLNTYLINNLYSNDKLINYNYNKYMDDTIIRLGTEKDYLATFVSYKLGLTGPSLTIQTSCSSSLVAIHYACQSILNGECDVSVAGGVAIRFPQRVGYLYSEDGIQSPDGHIKAFDKDAKGIVFGNGLGVVILKRADEAIKDNDNIYGIIKATTVNNDGKNKIGYTAPSVVGQSEVIEETIDLSEVDPESISYIETHGTGTILGDPIEFEGLKRAFSEFTDKKQFCAIGSVKTNIGHLSVASGVVGLIKICMMMKHKKIPPTLNFNEPNENIDFINSPFYLNNSLRNWNPSSNVRRAGLSSFGMGGTNAFALIEEYEREEVIKEANNEYEIIQLSAKSEDALNNLEADLLDYISNKEINIDDLAYTLSRRISYEFRRVYVAKDMEELKEKIRKSLSIEKDSNEYGEINELAINWINNGDVDFSMYFSGKVISLPNYPFDRKNCWIEPGNPIINNGVIKSSSDSVMSDNVRDWMYTPSWKRKESFCNNSNGEIFKGKKAIIFSDGSKVSKQIIDKVALCGMEVKVINYSKANEDNFIDVYSYEEYEKLIDNYKKIDFIPEIIISSFDNKDFSEDYQCLNDGIEVNSSYFYHLFNLVKALDNLGVKNKIRLIAVTNEMYEVIGNEKINPLRGLISGPLKVIPQEYANISCFNIDISTNKELSNIELEELINDFLYLDKPLVAYRNKYKWYESFEKIEIAENQVKNKIVDNGTYLLLGGLGTVGVQISEHISNISNCNIILVGRSIFPNKSSWNLWLKESYDTCEEIREFLEKDYNNTISKRKDISVESKKEYIENRFLWIKRKINRISNIEKNGCKVYFKTADVSNIMEMKNLIKEVNSEHGNLNGIIHAAVSSNNATVRPLMKNIGEKEVNNEFLSKVNGLVVLNEVTKDIKLDFIIVFSSLSSFLGGMGLVAYTSANVFADLFVKYINNQNNPWYAVNWDHWKDDEREITEKVHTSTEKYIMSKDQAYEAMKLVLTEINIPQVILCVGEIFKRYDIWINNVGLYLNGEEDNNTQYTGSKEEIVLQVWKDSMGIEEIELEDVFFDIGGNSLLALQIITKLEGIFGYRIQLKDFLENPTIKGITSLLEEVNELENDDMENFII